MRAALTTVLVSLLWPAATLGAPLPKLGSAPAFSLISQDRKPVRLVGLHGKIAAVIFLHPTFDAGQSRRDLLSLAEKP